MQIMKNTEKTTENEVRSKAEVLQALEPLVENLTEAHKQKRRLWMPNDFLPADEQMDSDQHDRQERLREQAKAIPDSERVALAMNLLTEEGLPHFHRLIAYHLGDSKPWQDWNFLWTAEEDRHGSLLRDYARESRLFEFGSVDQMQYNYQEAGFTPEWENDPYRLFVYTTLQERATQVSHRNTGKKVADVEPQLDGILKKIAAEEARHYSFYRGVFQGILEIDPNRALASALKILPAIDMPGLSMPNFREMSEVIRRREIYTPWDYKAIVEEAIRFWKVDVLTGLNEVGRAAQDKIMSIPKRLERIAEYIESRTKPRTFSFDFTYDREISLGDPV